MPLTLSGHLPNYHTCYSWRDSPLNQATPSARLLHTKTDATSPVILLDQHRVTWSVMYCAIVKQHECKSTNDTQNLSYAVTFAYTQQPLLLAILKRTRLLFLNPKQLNISNPYIMNVNCVFVSKCNTYKVVPTPEIYLQIYGTPNNACAN
jgi:hypothetical protein